MTFAPKLGGWKPDNSMIDAANHVDLKFEDNVVKIETSTSTNLGAAEINGVLDLRPWCSPVEDQSSAGSCVGNGVWLDPVCVSNITECKQIDNCPLAKPKASMCNENSCPLPENK